MKLSDAAARKAKPEAKSYKIADGGGMYLEVMPSGSKYWRLKYRYAGKKKRLALGIYPDVTLSAARTRRDDARKLLANGTDPSAAKQAKKAANVELAENSFEVIAREWFVRHSPNWKENHSSKIIARLEKDVFPWIGARPIAEIAAPALLAAIRRIEARGALKTAHRVLACCGQVFAMPWQPDVLSVTLQAIYAEHCHPSKKKNTLPRLPNQKRWVS